MNYKEYVKPELIKEFEKHCKANSLDFYSNGCILTAHMVMEKLMQHKSNSICKRDKVTPKEAWEDTMKQTDYHSGMSAAFTATVIAKYSLRGEEFKKWCVESDAVMVDWSVKK